MSEYYAVTTYISRSVARHLSVGAVETAAQPGIYDPGAVVARAVALGAMA